MKVGDPGMSGLSCSLADMYLLSSARVDGADSLIRCSPEEDATNGFFVSCFVKSIPEHAQEGLCPEHGSSSSPRTVQPLKRKREASDGLTSDSGQKRSNNKKRRKKTQKSSTGLLL